MVSVRIAGPPVSISQYHPYSCIEGEAERELVAEAERELVAEVERELDCDMIEFVFENGLNEFYIRLYSCICIVFVLYIYAVYIENQFCIII